MLCWLYSSYKTYRLRIAARVYGPLQSLIVREIRPPDVNIVIGNSINNTSILYTILPVFFLPSPTSIFRAQSSNQRPTRLGSQR